MPMKWMRLLVPLLLLTTFLGCSGKADPRLKVKTYPVRGKVLVGGVPAGCLDHAGIQGRFGELSDPSA